MLRRPGRYSLVAGLAMLLPTAGAAVVGTPEDPELVDQPGDVTYDDPGPHDSPHDYLDITQAWWSYDPDSDTVALSIQVADASELDPPPDNWWILGELGADVLAGGAEHGKLTYTVVSRAFDPEIRGTLTYSPEVANTARNREIATEFSIQATAPGLFVFAVPRPELQAIGDQLGNPWIRLGETYRASESSPAVTGLGDNYDEGSSQEGYDLSGLAPAPVAEEGSAPGRSPEPTTSGPSASAAGAGAAAAVLCLSLAAAWATRARRRRL